MDIFMDIHIHGKPDCRPILTVFYMTCTHTHDQLLIAGHATGPERVFMAATTLTRMINFLSRRCLCKQWSPLAVMYGQLSRVHLSSEQLSVHRYFQPIASGQGVEGVKVPS